MQMLDLIAFVLAQVCVAHMQFHLAVTPWQATAPTRLYCFGWCTSESSSSTSLLSLHRRFNLNHAVVRPNECPNIVTIMVNIDHYELLRVVTRTHTVVQAATNPRLEDSPIVWCITGRHFSGGTSDGATSLPIVEFPIEEKANPVREASERALP
jgi:hypothetical protein